MAQRTWESEVAALRNDIQTQESGPADPAAPTETPVAEPPQPAAPPTIPPQAGPATRAPSTATPPQPIAGPEPGEIDQLRESNARGVEAFRRLNGNYSAVTQALRQNRDVQVEVDKEGLPVKVTFLSRAPQARPQPPQATVPQPPPQPAPAGNADEEAAIQAYMKEAEETYGAEFAQKHAAAIRAMATKEIRSEINRFREELEPTRQGLEDTQRSLQQQQVEQNLASFDAQVSAVHVDWKQVVGVQPDGSDADPEFVRWVYGHPMARTYIHLLYPQPGQFGAEVPEFCNILTEFRKTNPRDVATDQRAQEEQRRLAAAAASVRPNLHPAAPIPAGDVQPMNMDYVIKRSSELANQPEAHAAFMAEVDKAEKEGRLYGNLPR